MRLYTICKCNLGTKFAFIFHAYEISNKLICDTFNLQQILYGILNMVVPCLDHFFFNHPWFLYEVSNKLICDYSSFTNSDLWHFNQGDSLSKSFFSSITLSSKITKVISSPYYLF